MNFAGLPPHISFAGTDFTTTEPAAITEPAANAYSFTNDAGGADKNIIFDVNRCALPIVAGVGVFPLFCFTGVKVCVKDAASTTNHYVVANFNSVCTKYQTSAYSCSISND